MRFATTRPQFCSLHHRPSTSLLRSEASLLLPWIQSLAIALLSRLKFCLDGWTDGYRTHTYAPDAPRSSTSSLCTLRSPPLRPPHDLTTLQQHQQASIQARTISRSLARPTPSNGSQTNASDHDADNERSSTSGRGADTQTPPRPLIRGIDHDASTPPCSRPSCINSLHHAIIPPRLFMLCSNVSVRSCAEEETKLRKQQ
jgi:hypothetical protein